MKKFLSLFISALLLLSAVSVPALAAAEPTRKEEVVYGLLSADGGVEKIIVVNIFNEGKLLDYGNYSEIKNLSSTEKIKQTGDVISAAASAKRLYYQGTLKSKELPWDIKIGYALDGKAVTASELAGKEGALEIAINIARNEKVDPTFFENYALQLSLQLDAGLCENIKAEGFVEANAGGKKQFTYTVLPGRGADIRITADVRDFQMDAITISGIKMLLDMELDYGDFAAELSGLTEAAAGLDGGAAELLDGARRLSEGMKAYIDGLKKYGDGLASFGGGAEELKRGAAALSGGLAELAKQNDALTAGADALRQAAFDAANAQLAAYAPEGLAVPELTPDNYGAILSSVPELSSLKAQLDGAVQFAQGLKSYTDGVARLGGGAKQLENGAERFASASSELAQSAGELYKAGAELNSAIEALYDGLASYREGTAEFKKGAADLDEQIIGRAEEMVRGLFGNGDEVVSFASEKNTNITAVQFVLKTAPIEKPREPSGETRQEEKISFWRKLLKLFGL